MFDQRTIQRWMKEQKTISTWTMYLYYPEKFIKTMYLIFCFHVLICYYLFSFIRIVIPIKYFSQFFQFILCKINILSKKNLMQEILPKRQLTIPQIIHKIESQNLYFIGVCGIPGAGKSTISDKLKQSLSNSIVIPMDGFHLYRKDLDEQGLRRRGAPFTFDLKRFQQKLLYFKQLKSFPVKFPSFDHALKDPIQDDIQITEDIKHVIIEGLYVFDKSLELDEHKFWDLKIFVDEAKQTCLPRLIKRCVEKKIQETEEKAIQRATKSDLVNGDYVLQNSSHQNLWYVKNPDHN